MFSRLPSRERQRLLISLALGIIGLAFIFLVTAEQAPIGDYFLAGDGHYLAMTARSIAFDGDLDLTNQYRQWGDRWQLGQWPTRDGWRLPPRSIGPALLMVPGLWLHDLFGDPTTSYGPWSSIGPALTPAVCFWLISFRLDRLRPDAHGTHSPAAAFIAIFAFVLPYYAWGRSAYPHAGDALAASVLLFVLLRDEPKAAPVGLAIGLCVLMRYQNVLWWLWPAWVYARPADAEPWRERMSKLLVLTLCAGVGLLPTAYLAWAHPGSEVGVIRWTADFFNFDDYLGDLVDVLVGVHGLLSWTPIAALALAGLLIPAPRARDRQGFAIVFVAMWLLMATVLDPNAGTAFGARRLASYTPVFAWGLFRLYESARRHSSQLELAVLTISALLCIFNLAGTWEAIHGRLDLSS
jgi:hypothetical protein